MKNKLQLGIYVSALAIGASLIPTDSTAGSYSAICQDGGECNVILINGKINIPGLSIDSDDVISWSQGGKGSQNDIGMGVATTLFLDYLESLALVPKNMITNFTSTISITLETDR